MSVRVRFAPSPTGHLHIGGLRTALFNWLFARKHNGTFLVRIEDTDRERYTKEHEQSIIRSLEWFGIQPDEPLVYQFARQPLHQTAWKKLLSAGRAYRCYCSRELLQEKRAAAEAEQGFYQYDGTCRSINQTSDRDHVIRFKIEADTILTFQDIIRGEVSLQRNQLDDFIIARTDGSVTYNFAVVEDDHFMEITHIIRGEDHLLNTFKQMLLYQALEYQLPQFAHLPLILSQSGQKLSKRDAAVSVDEYTDLGFLPEALGNYLVRLGWSHGDQEIFTKDELIRLFSLDNVQKKGAVFDFDKLRWVNSVYLQNSDSATLFDALKNNMKKDLTLEFPAWSLENSMEAISVYKTRSATLIELFDQIRSLYFAPQSYNSEDLSEWIDNQIKIQLSLLEEKLQSIMFSKTDLAAIIKQFCKEHGCNMGQIAQPIRIALCGAASGPGLFDMLLLLGKEESLQRLQKFANS